MLDVPLSIRPPSNPFLHGAGVSCSGKYDLEDTLWCGTILHKFHESVRSSRGSADSLGLINSPPRPLDIKAHRHVIVSRGKFTLWNECWHFIRREVKDGIHNGFLRAALSPAPRSLTSRGGGPPLPLALLAVSAERRSSASQTLRHVVLCDRPLVCKHTEHCFVFFQIFPNFLKRLVFSVAHWADWLAAAFQQPFHLSASVHKLTIRSVAAGSQPGGLCIFIFW